MDTVSLVERLHRRFFEVVKEELDRLGVDDINNVQAMIVYNIGDEELTVGELTQRGCYMGTNVTYNLKKLISAGYVTQHRSPRDRRSVRVKLSGEGQQLFQRMDRVFEVHTQRLAAELTEGDLVKANQLLHELDRFWSDKVAVTPVPVRRARSAA